MSELSLGIVLFYIILFYFIFLYNKIIKSSNRVDYSIGGIDTILKKRIDLIPNIVSLVKEHNKFEKNIFERISDLRDKKKDKIVEKDAETSSLLALVMMEIKNDPSLSTNSSFLQLLASLNEIEEQLSAARRTYNANVMVFNNRIETVPSNVLATLMSLQKEPMFEAQEIDRKTPNLKELLEP